MSRSISILTSGAALGLLLGLTSCDLPECIQGPSNLTPEATASCAAPPNNITPESAIHSAGAELRNDGTLVVTLSSMGLACGTEAAEVLVPDDCWLDGWVFTLEIPPELAVPGVISLAEHPEVRGTMMVADGFNGGQVGTSGEPFFVGELELTDVGDGCITGILRSFGTGNPDPTLGGPELDGSFVAPRC
ncbi:MAG TPA: hypothetical protein VK034_19305 [Enhygromyxa sp.]|nr:hypothetical protein [Enhygromyxa sp.]